MGMTARFELFVSEVNVAANFYERVLGFTRGKDVGHYVDVRNGDVQIGIALLSYLPEDHHLRQHGLEAPKGVGVEIVLEVDDLDLTYQQVQESGYPIHETMTERPWGSRDFRLVDPDGYYLRITDK